jgi:hypothetical protein
LRPYKTIILPVILYGCKTWSLTLRREHRLRVLDNRVLRKISGPKRDEVTGEWRKLQNELRIVTHPQISLTDQVTENEVSRPCDTHGRGEKCTRFW